jgi:ADP-heptose:LPS heptosyltransferase
MGAKQRVLIFQIGSLGDTAIAMPCYREIARRHPNSERLLLTNFPIGKKMVQAEALLAPCALIDGSVEYPMPLRGIRETADLLRKLRSLRIDELYYLMPEKRLLNMIRHYVFFKICGVGKVHGVPWRRDARFPKEIVSGALWESEASRLLRSLQPDRKPGAPPPGDRRLDLSEEERDCARRLLSEVPGMTRFIAVSVGGKVPINNWGNENWARVLEQISTSQPGLGAVFVGSADERERNERLAQAWRGPRLNSCGRLAPRQTAALIEKARLFLGHDTGTLHLAAAVNTPVLGIFSARNVPGKWYSDRPHDQFFYNKQSCFGCELEKVEDCPTGVACMKRHKVEEVVAATLEMLSNVACLDSTIEKPQQSPCVPAISQSRAVTGSLFTPGRSGIPA